MMAGQIILGFLGLCFGGFVSGGVFTVLLSVGLIPRFAGKSHTNRKVFLYEEMVVFGTLAGNILTLFPQCKSFGSWMSGLPGIGMIWPVVGCLLLILYGVFAGMFVGCLALAIAEMLDSIPIFARRIGFRHGLGVAVTAIALGKMCGSLLYFAMGIFRVT